MSISVMCNTCFQQVKLGRSAPYVCGYLQGRLPVEISTARHHASRVHEKGLSIDADVEGRGSGAGGVLRVFGAISHHKNAPEGVGSGHQHGGIIHRSAIGLCAVAWLKMVFATVVTVEWQ